MSNYILNFISLILFFNYLPCPFPSVFHVKSHSLSRKALGRLFEMKKNTFQDRYMESSWPVVLEYLQGKDIGFLLWSENHIYHLQESQWFVHPVKRSGVENLFTIGLHRYVKTIVVALHPLSFSCGWPFLLEMISLCHCRGWQSFKLHTGKQTFM